jgi:hypothetical protein
MDVILPDGTEANFPASPTVGELGVVTFARQVAAYLHQHLQRTPDSARYSEEGPERQTTRLTYRLDGHAAEVTIRHGKLELVVDGDAVELPPSPRDPAWAVAWAIHWHVDDQDATERSSHDRTGADANL